MSQHDSSQPSHQPVPQDLPTFEDSVPGESDSNGGITEESEFLYRPEPGESQLTFRAVFVGCLLGMVVASMNIYFGLKTGWSIGGSLVAAILGFATFAVLQQLIQMRKYTILETNITQTSGSAAGSMTSAAGLLSAIPALHLMGVELSYGEMTLWAASVGFLGVFFAVPLRNQMVVVEKLRFPTGTATAETITSMFATGDQAMRQARALLLWALGAGIFTLLNFFVPQVGHPPFEDWIPAAALITLSGYGFSVLISPLMFGAGVLIGPRVGISLFLGAVVSWGIIAPLANKNEWVADPTAIMSYKEGARGWILWPGVAIMVADALTNLALSWKTILNTFKKKTEGEASEMEAASEQIPPLWWLGGLALGTLLVTFTAHKVFEIPWYMTLIAVAMSSVLAMIAVRSVGETDINPTGGMGKVTQLAFGGIAQGDATTNIMAAGITSAGASQAGDMMQDLKTGRLLGASPRKQMIAQCIGILAGILVCVPIFRLFVAAGEKDPSKAIGGPEMPAPAAQAWKAMAEVLSAGFDALPMHAPKAVLCGAAFGIAVPVLRKLMGEKGKWMPSGLAFGIAFIVPAYYSIAMFAGSMMFLAWSKANPKSAKIFAFAIASGLIAGEGLMGVVTAVLTLLGLGPLT